MSLSASNDSGFLARATGYVTERVTSASELMNSYGLKYVIYALCFGIALATILMVVDNFYPFLPINPVSGPSADARNSLNFWPSNAENLVVPANQSPTTSASAYTMSVQLMIGDSRTPSLGKYRHIVHRGSNPCGISAGSAGPSGQEGMSSADIPALVDPSYEKTGLPSLMNPGIFLDKYNNDVHIFIHTKAREGSNTVLLLESLTIADLPLQTAITIGISCNGNVFEVYVNCRLYSTLYLKGMPYLASAANQWFGRYCAYPMSGVVQNLTLWPTPLGSSDYIQMCRTPSLDKSALPASCPT